MTLHAENHFTDRSHWFHFGSIVDEEDGFGWSFVIEMLRTCTKSTAIARTIEGHFAVSCYSWRELKRR